MAEEPLAPAWDDVITVSDPTRGTRYNLQIAALWTPMHSIVRGEEEKEEGSGTALGFAPYQIPEMRPSMGDDDFQMQAKALVHISKPPGGGEGDAQGMQVDGFFLLLFEVGCQPPNRPTRPSTNTSNPLAQHLPPLLPPSALERSQHHPPAWPIRLPNFSLSPLFRPNLQTPSSKPPHPNTPDPS